MRKRATFYPATAFCCFHLPPGRLSSTTTSLETIRLYIFPPDRPSAHPHPHHDDEREPFFPVRSTNPLLPPPKPFCFFSFSLRRAAPPFFRGYPSGKGRVAHGPILFPQVQFSLFFSPLMRARAKRGGGSPPPSLSARARRETPTPQKKPKKPSLPGGDPKKSKKPKKAKNPFHLFD